MLYKKDTDIEIQDIDIKKEYMKVSAKFSKPEFIDTVFKEINLEQAILTIPVNYAPKHKKENEVDAVMDWESVKYIEIDTRNEEFRLEI